METPGEGDNKEMENIREIGKAGAAKTVGGGGGGLATPSQEAPRQDWLECSSAT